MTKRCPGRCGRVLHVDHRICPSCRSKLTYSQRAKVDAGGDITEILSNITTTSSWSSSTYDSGSSYSSDSSSSGSCDSGGSF